MSISIVRSYFKSRVLDEIPQAVEHKDLFDLDNIQNSKDKVYHITYQNTGNIETHGDRITDSVSVSLSILFKAYRNVQSVFDTTSDSAHNIKRRASKISNYSNGIKRVVCNSINISPLD